MVDRVMAAINYSDATGKELFFDRLAMKHLIEEFLVEGLGVSWTLGRKLAAAFDIDGMEPMRTEHIEGETGREYRQDVVWRVPRRGGREGDDLYIFVLVELQSTVDWTMAHRVRLYVALIHQDLIKRGKVSKPGRLPLVLPIVFYTGAAEWEAPTIFADLAHWDAWEEASRNEGSLFTGDSYVLLSVRDLAKRPLPPENVVSLYVEIEALSSIDAMQEIVRRVFDLLSGEERRTLRNLLHSMLVEKTPNDRVKEFLKDIEMLERHHDEGTLHDELHRQWARIQSEEQEKGRKKGYQEGHEEGHEEGRQEGRQEERALRLASQRKLVGQFAAKCFGEDETAWLADRLEGVDDPDLLDSLLIWIYECGSVAELEERTRTL